MGKINVLGFDIANLIAAGEVVDRPASVVKELMENAIDAGAKNITVEIRGGGTSLIRVTDDGGGIERDDLPVAVLRHATSKISSVTDLSEIMTLGFRGEALAAIASVSRLRITSKTPQASIGSKLTVEYGEIVDLSDAGSPDGTTVICESLFANVPARRKFLKKDSTETAAVTAVVEKAALSSPQISIRYITDGETKFHTPGNGDLSGVIYIIYGREVASRLRPIKRSEGGLSVDGFISEPDFFRPNRNLMNFFINHRYVKSRTMGAAVEQAYNTHIPPDKFPFCIINFTINPEAVDVNVHPSKLEVKFTNERLVFEAVYYAVLNGLESGIDRPELNIGQRIYQPKEQYRPSRDVNTLAPQQNKSFWVSGEDATKLLSEFSSDERKSKNEQLRFTSLPQEITPTEDSSLEMERQKMNELASLLGITREDEEGPATTLAPEDEERYINIIRDAPFPFSSAPPEYSLDWIAEKYPIDPDESPASEPFPDDIVVHSIEELENAEIIPEEGKNEEDDVLVPEYLILGEAYNCYIIVQLSDRLVLIDKHAAHERIIFDSLVEKMKKKEKHSQILMFSIDVPLTDSEKDAIREFDDQIRGIGFDFELTDSGVSLKAIPEEITREAASEMIVDLAGSLAENIGTIESVGNEYFDARLYQASCKAAIKGGRIYARENLRYICDRVLREPKDGESAIKTCPHGRPVAFEIKKNSIERQFQRLV